MAFLTVMIPTVEQGLENFLEQVGERLIELRKSKGYSSHEHFAVDHDLPRIQYWRLEKGKANFTIRTLARICHIHKISLDEFFSSIYSEGTRPMPKKKKAG